MQYVSEANIELGCNLKAFKIGVLAKQDGWHCQDLVRASNDQVELKPVSYTRLATLLQNESETFSSSDTALDDLDALLIRAMPAGSLEQVVFRMDVLQRLFESGLPMVNTPKTIEASVDKYLSLALLKRAKIPIPPTAVCQTAEEAQRLFQRLGGDVVVKPIFGSQGRGLKRINSPEDSRELFDELESQGNVIYLQKFLHHGGSDIRLFVIGDQVLGMKRTNESSWITNVCNGGIGKPYSPTDEEIALALASAKAVGGSLIGIDLIYENGIPFCVEVNSSPGWQAISKSLNVDVARLVLDHMEQIAKQGR